MRKVQWVWVLVLVLAIGIGPAYAQDGDNATDEELALKRALLKAETEKAQAEADKARAEAERARAEADRAKAEADRAKAEADRAQQLAAGPEPEDKPGRHRHDGFFLRLATGLGYEGFSVDGDVSVKNYPTTFRAPSQHAFGSGFVFSIGGCPKENLALHADFVASTPWATNSEPYRHIFGAFGLGLGVTHYFMPDNFFITGSLGISSLAMIVIEESPVVGDREHDKRTIHGSGPLFSVMLGKEWWVSDNWGLGVALRGQYGLAFMPDTLLGHHGHALVMFTATYN